MSKVAAIQMISNHHVEENLQTAAALIEQAVEQQAGLVVLPEDFAFIGLKEGDKLTVQEEFGVGPIQDFLTQQAKRHRICLIAGALPLRDADAEAEAETDKCYSACLVFDEKGDCIARYNKIHLFDVSVDDKQSYQETAVVAAGDKIVTVQTSLACVGLSICYDLRFPELYRALLSNGAEIMVVPSAFTDMTGQAHWEVLLRARAIENLCYIIAANQGGIHASGRETYGHSMIIDPWGVVLDSCEQGPGVVCAEVDLTHLQQIRQRFPSIAHRRIDV